MTSSLYGSGTGRSVTACGWEFSVGRAMKLSNEAVSTATTPTPE
jgi:hypothetical protein